MPTATTPAAGSRRATIRQSSHRDAGKKANHSTGVPTMRMYRTTCSPAGSVRPCGFHSRIGRPVTSQDHGPDSHGCGEDSPLWNVSHWACSCHRDRRASGTKGYAVSGCCCAHALPCDVSPRNQPVNDAR